ncbi:MAG: STAS domain-containing protein [Leptolyngbyaceae cyanobacterium bins.349]|nr:STAS domain-containing protein [Leptolyngbyaceae cyanobacterium bins.349]
MKISTREVYDVLVVDMEGRLDSKTSGYGYEELVRLVKGDKKHVVINLQKLEFITSAGLRSLLVAAKLLQTDRGELRLCNPNDVVKDVLESAGFSSLLRLYPTEADAIKGF